MTILARRRTRPFQRSEAEQLDYEMELLRAQREGREEEFKQQEREKRRAKFAASLDAEMDEYFKSRPKDDETANGDNAPAGDTDKPSTKAEGSTGPTPELQPTEEDLPENSDKPSEEVPTESATQN